VTTVSEISRDLLGKTRPLPGGSSSESDWEAIFAEFVKTKRACGEGIDNLTYEKFQSTLVKNRSTIMQRYRCDDVRFTVYVKDGRASLKATPVNPAAK